MWEKETRLINNLGALYPTFKTRDGVNIRYEIYKDNKLDCVWWVCFLCTDHLNARIPSLEKFLRMCDLFGAWNVYKYNLITNKK